VKMHHTKTIPRCIIVQSHTRGDLKEHKAMIGWSHVVAITQEEKSYQTCYHGILCGLLPTLMQFPPRNLQSSP